MRNKYISPKENLNICWIKDTGVYIYIYFLLCLKIRERFTRFIFILSIPRYLRVRKNYKILFSLKKKTNRNGVRTRNILTFFRTFDSTLYPSYLKKRHGLRRATRYKFVYRCLARDHGATSLIFRLGEIPGNRVFSESVWLGRQFAPGNSNVAHPC